ncbi:hypothetical protein PSEMO_57370 [Pseudomonas putida]|uniref:Uncharacterized protein n=1 Tax=Pseudomonas putida TaxID=303 RepID=A0A1Q9QVS2_PSEPU|nr:hypothetical protein PSEMO_57370 [Pseudomonas putida]
MTGGGARFMVVFEALHLYVAEGGSGVGHESSQVGVGLLRGQRFLIAVELAGTGLIFLVRRWVA